MGKALAGIGKPPPWTAKRRPSPGIRQRIKQSGQRIGDLALAWNAAQEGIFELLRHLVCEGDFGRAKSVWIDLKTDKARLQLLKAVYPTALAHRTTLKNAVEWTVKRVEGYAEIRNDAVHIHLMDWGGEATPHFLMTKDGALKRYAERPWELEVSEVAGDLRAIGDYAMGIAMALRPERPHPYVRRPQLVSSLGRELMAGEKKAAATKARKAAGVVEREERNANRASRARSARAHLEGGEDSPE